MTKEAVPTWAADRLGKLPARWRERLEYQWRKHCNIGKHWDNGTDWDKAKADAWLTRRLSELEAGALAGIHPAMDDMAICKLAEAEARDHGDRQAQIAGEFRQAMRREVTNDDMGAALLQLLAADALHTMQKRGMGDLYPDGKTMTEAGKLARLKCRAFWRRVLRKVHARTVEQCAIALGLVHGKEDAYISRESLRIQQARAAANAAMLANTIAVGEDGQEMTLASVAERSVSNPTIRRGELMTRVAGFELCADQLGHVKRWAVLTLPSKYHKFLQIENGPVVENRKYRGIKPREAQQVLAQQWRKCCAWWERQGLRVYGFRTTEPHKDGTPHWNVLCFFAPMTERVQLKKVCKIERQAVPVFDEGLLNYFLNYDSPEEHGAKKVRVRIEAIDNSKGSAAAYIAKYISKGIDGKGLDVDLWGNPIERSAAAVVAWSKVWGIRQFQQIGGPPVTVWRELRKVNPENVGSASETAHNLREAMAAVNLRMDSPDEKMAVAWQRYTTTQGGPCAKRKGWTVRMLQARRQEPNRYGEAMAARVVGVWAVGTVTTPAPAHILAMRPNTQDMQRQAMTAIESERGAWIVVPKSGADDAIRDHCERLEKLLTPMREADASRKAALAVLEGQLSSEELRQREALAPWTRVNNCTATPTLNTLDRRHLTTAAPGFGLVKRKRAKLGRHFQFQTREAGGLSHQPTERTT